MSNDKHEKKPEDYSFEDFMRVPHAGGWSIILCNNPNHVHVVLFDVNDKKPELQITLDRNRLDSLTQAMNETRPAIGNQHEH